MVRRRCWPAAVAAVVTLVAGCSNSSAGTHASGKSSTTPGPLNSTPSPTAVAPGYGAGTAFLPLIKGGAWSYVYAGAPGAIQHLTYQITGISTSLSGTTADVTVTTGSRKVAITYLVDASHNVHVQLSAGSLSGSFIIPASPLSCSPCRYTATFTGSVPGFPPFTEDLTEVVTSAGTVGLIDPENHKGYPGTAHLHATIDVVPAAGGPPVSVSTTEEVYLAPGVGIVQDGRGVATVTVAGSPHSSPTGTLWLTSYVP